LPADEQLVSSANSELLQTNIFALVGDSLGQVWTASDRQIGVWSSNSYKQVLSLDHVDDMNNNPPALAGSLAGGCWVAVEGRLRKFTRYGCAVDYGTYPWSGRSVFRMLEDHHGQLWVGTYGSGLYCYDTNGVPRHFSLEDGLPGGFIRSLCEDKEGN